MARKPDDKPWSRAIPDGPWDAIVVGSGMGGMATAALLARVGRRVLVLEQHDVPGGFTHTFRRGGSRTGYTWDVGVHAVGEVTEHTLSGRVLSDLSGGELSWDSLGPVYDAFDFPDGFRIDFPDSPARFRANLVAAFPHGETAIDTYLDLCKQAGESMRGYYLARILPEWTSRFTDPTLARAANRLLGRTADEVLSEWTDDKRLKAVLCAQWAYHGATPRRASIAMQALVARHFLHGAYYPRGGSASIARTLLGTVAQTGGWTAVVQDVERILVERGRAVGVRLTEGGEIRAPIIVSAAGVGATVSRMLPDDLRDAAWSKSIAALEPGPAHLCLYLGFKGDIRAAGASAANRWFYETWDTEDDAWRVPPEGDPGRTGVLYCSFPSLKDPLHDDPLRHTGEVVTFVPWDVFADWRETAWKKRPELYDAFKQRLHDALLAQFFEHMPALKPFLHFSELSTPLSTDHFVRPQRGSIYGLLPTPARFRNPWLRPRSPVPGLFFAGSEVASVGVMGAMMGGVLAAAAVAPWDVGRHLRRFV